MFSKSCQYAIKAMIYVAQKSKGGSRVSVKDIAAGIDAPIPFTAKILQELSRRRLVHSVKGPHGGFYLDTNENQVAIADIVRAIDGEVIYNDCVLGLKKCSEKNPCPVHFEYKDIKRKLIRMIENKTINDFKNDLDQGIYQLKL